MMLNDFMLTMRSGRGLSPWIEVCWPTCKGIGEGLCLSGSEAIAGHHAAILNFVQEAFDSTGCSMIRTAL